MAFPSDLASRLLNAFLDAGGGTTAIQITSATATGNPPVQGDLNSRFSAAFVDAGGGTTALQTTGGGSGTPGGATTEVQFNNAGAFDGSPNLTWVSPALTIGVNAAATGAVVLANGNPSGTSVTIQNNTALSPWTWSIPSGPGTTNFVLATDGVGQTGWVAQSGGASLDAITAAVADQAGISNADWNIVWNWAKTTDSEVAFTFGESAASTGGTSTSGIPNQVILHASTLAASTASPFKITIRGNHALSASPSTTQLLLADGSGTVPILARASATGTGLSFFTLAGAQTIIMNGSGSSIVFIPAGGPTLIRSNSGGFRLSDSTTTARIDLAVTANIVEVYAPSNAASAIRLNVNGLRGTEFNLDGSSNNVAQFANALATTTGYAFNFRKSRGTVAAPTVITTGDKGGTINFDFYVGGTNTYQRAAYMEGRSTGAISDSITGVGGILAFAHAIVGNEPAEVAMFHGQHLIHEGSSPTITSGGGTGPSIAGKDEGFDVTIGTGGVDTTFTVTYATAFSTNAPVCIAQSNTDIVALSCASVTTGVVVTSATPFSAGSIVHVISRGWI